MPMFKSYLTPRPRPQSCRGRRKAERAGRYAEIAVHWYLRLQGYQIIAKRYRTPVGELDVVARRRKRYRFVEVKFRRDKDRLWEAFPTPQQLRVRRAAQWFIMRHNLERCEATIDCVFVARWHFHYLKNVL